MPDILCRVRFSARYQPRAFRALLGSTVLVTIEFVDATTGALVPGVSGVSLSAIRPDGSPQSWGEGALTPINTGRWAVDVTVDQPGSWAFSGACNVPQPEVGVATLAVVTNIADLGDGGAGAADAAASAAASAATAAAIAASVGAVVVPYLTPVSITSATALTRELHNNRVLRLGAGASLSASWANTGNGFSCHLLNRSGAVVPLTISGFTAAAPVNPFSASSIANLGTAALMVQSHDGGATRECWLTGDLAL